MADIRINALATTAASTASDDFVAVDGSANGTRKLNAYSPTFGGNLTVSGTGGIQLNSVANLTWGGSYGAGIPTIAIPSATSIGFYPTGSTSGKTFELFGTGNATLTGALTVSGTGTSSFAGSVSIAKVLPTDFGALSVSNDLGSSATKLEAGVSGSGRGGTYFGQSEANSSLIFSNGTSSNGLLIGSFNAKQVVIGTNNTAAISISGTTQATTLSGNLTVSGGTATISKSSTTTGPVLQLENTNDAIDAGGTLGRLQFYSGDDSGGGNSVRAWIDSIQTTATPVGSALRFAVANGANAAGEVVRIAESGNLLLKTDGIDSGNGKLQLAESTASTGGIGFGPDIALYRAGGNTLKLELGVSAGVLWFDNGGLGTGGARILGSSGALTVTSNGANSLYLQTGGTTALTLDSSQHFKLTPAVASSITTTQSAPQIRMGSRASGRSNVVLDSTAGRVWSLENTGTSLTVGYSGLDAITIAETTGDATFAGTVTAQQLNALDAAANNRSAAIIRAQNNTTYSSSVLSVQGDRTTTNSSYNLILAQNAAVTGQFIVRDSGNVVNTNNSYGAISDRKLKENIVDTAPKLAEIAKIQIRDYNLIGKTETQTGVIAQELETVFPSLVESFTDRDAEGNDLGTVTKTVKYSQLVPLLVKALQELRIDFETYKAAHP